MHIFWNVWNIECSSGINGSITSTESKSSILKELGTLLFWNEILFIYKHMRSYIVDRDIPCWRTVLVDSKRVYVWSSYYAAAGTFTVVIRIIIENIKNIPKHGIIFTIIWPPYFYENWKLHGFICNAPTFYKMNGSIWAYHSWKHLYFFKVEKHTRELVVKCGAILYALVRQYNHFQIGDIWTTEYYSNNSQEFAYVNSRETHGCNFLFLCF